MNNTKPQKSTSWKKYAKGCSPSSNSTCRRVIEVHPSDWYCPPYQKCMLGLIQRTTTRLISMLDKVSIAHAEALTKLTVSPCMMYVHYLKGSSE
jgi:hypothetical protein